MNLRIFTISALVLTAVLLPPGASAQENERTPKDIQQTLSDKGFKLGVVDGVWGKRSTAALKAFQSSNGLPSTGKVDPRTIEVLFAAPQAAALPAPSSVEEKVPTASGPGLLVEPANVTAPRPTESASPPAEVPKTATPSAPASADQPKSPAEPSPLKVNESNGQTSGSPVSFLFFVALVIGIIALFSKRKKKHDEFEPDAGYPNAPAKVALDSLRPVYRPTLAADNDTLTIIEEPTAPSTLKSSLFDHDTAVKDWIREKGGTFGTREPDVVTRPAAPKAPISPPSSSGWLSKNASISVGGITISGGLIYVGGFLPKQGRPYEMENCLIDPKLKVSRSGDPEGTTMGYWPSYAYMTPEARRSYLEWLASDRSNPYAYIGFVFLYFYGLERRLLLEKNAPDASLIVDEVRRLVDIYGGNHSFNRYAMELLTAVELQSGEPSAQFLARVEPNGFEVPTAVKIALGIRVRDNRAIDANLMLRFAMTHPETRVRTPARRAPELLQQLYFEKLDAEFPDGYRYKAGRTKALQKRYKACSSSFEVDIDVLGGGLPDITHRAEPIGTARRIFDECTDALDDYSRALGKLEGLKPNLSAVSKLPPSLRATQANVLQGRPLEKLEELVAKIGCRSVSEIAQAANHNIGTPPSRAKLRELSQLLSSFGYGVTFDPTYATKTASANDPAMLFRLSLAAPSEPSPHYRAAQFSLMLGLLVGLADGNIDEKERALLLKTISSFAGLEDNDRNRLEAELKLHEAHPDRLDDWMKKLKDIPADSKDSVAAELVSVASADGSLHAAEIRKLETIFKRMGIEQTSLYERLHAGSNSAQKNDASLPAQASPSATRTAIDLSHLQRIRSETSVTANVLAEIFADDEPAEAPAPIAEAVTARSESDLYDGLEQRYGTLLDELRAQTYWSAEDFEHLARDAGLMPGAARERINDWSFDTFDEAMIEGDDPIEIAVHLLPSTIDALRAEHKEGMPA